MINYTTKIVLSHLIKKNKSNENQMNPNQINIWLRQDVQLCPNTWNKHDNKKKQDPKKSVTKSNSLPSNLQGSINATFFRH